MVKEFSTIFSKANLPPPDEYQQGIIDNFIKEKDKVCYVVNAAAGSGKTSLLNYLILALIHNGVSTDKIATLTLNRKVASELNGRVRNAVKQKDRESLKVAYTFHSFATKFIENIGSKNFISEESSSYEFNLYHCLQQSAIDKEFANNAEFKACYDAISEQFLPKDSLARNITNNENNRDLSLKLQDARILAAHNINLGDKELVASRINSDYLNTHTLRGDAFNPDVISSKYFKRMIDIANRLYLKNILYELKIEKSDKDERAIFYIKPYKHDLNTESKDCIIEVTGATEEEKVIPFYDDSYVVQKDNKTDWSKFNGKALSKNEEDKKLNDFLHKSLNQAFFTVDMKSLGGSTLRYRPKDEVLDELIQITERFRCSRMCLVKPEDFPSTIDDLVEKYKNFHNDANIDYKQLGKLISVLKFFYAKIFSKYTFTKLLEEAAFGQVYTRRVSLDYLFIDEAQDLNSLFVKIVRKIINANKNIKILVVGDKAQAINRFIGAESTYVFPKPPKKPKDKYFPGDAPKQFNLPITYRLDSNLVDFVNNIMSTIEESLNSKKLKNGAVIEIPFSFNRMKTLKVAKSGIVAIRESKIVKASQDNEQVNGNNKVDFNEVLKDLYTIVSKIHKKNKKWKIALLASTHNLMDTNIHEIKRRILDRHRTITKENNLKLVASSIHKYKGLEADAVIILDAGSENYTMRASELHKRILFGAGIKTDCIDAACLWYVAITRAKHFMCLYSYDKEISYKDDINILAKTANYIIELDDDCTQLDNWVE